MVRVVSLSSADLITRGLPAVKQIAGIRSLVGFGKLVRPLVHPVLYPQNSITTPYLNMFRREQAIAQFDWPFTPIHSSSGHVSMYIGSALHGVLPPLQPGHG
jgi:hypothetical protein